MSSSPPTEPAGRPPARWRGPAGWSLRTRLVARRDRAAGGARPGRRRHHRRSPCSTILLRARLDAQLDDGGRPRRAAAAGAGGPGRADRGSRPAPSGRRTSADRPRWTRRGRRRHGRVRPADDEHATPVRTPVTADAQATDARRGAGRRPSRTRRRPAATSATTGVVADARADGDGVIVTGLPLADDPGHAAAVALVDRRSRWLRRRAGRAGLAGAVIVRRTLRPLRPGRRHRHPGLRAAAATAARWRSPQRVPDADTDPRTEVGQVGAALNRMLDHVGNALDGAAGQRDAGPPVRRRRQPRAAHPAGRDPRVRRAEPARPRAGAATTSRTRCGRVESEAQRMTALVEDLLLLARLDAGRPLAHDPVDLSPLVVDAVSDAHAAGPGPPLAARPARGAGAR